MTPPAIEWGGTSAFMEADGKDTHHTFETPLF